MPFILLSTVFFAVMALTVRALSNAIPSTQTAAFRHALGLGTICAFLLLTKRRPDTRRLDLLALRGLLGGAAVLTYFVAIERLGAARATVLNYTSPIYAALWARLFLNEKATRRTASGLFIATIGAAFVALSSFTESPSWPSLSGSIAGLASGVLGGGAIAAVKAARTQSDSPTVFASFSLFGLALSAPLALHTWVTPTSFELLLLLLVGLTALVGQILFTHGMASTTATLGGAGTQLIPALAWVGAVFLFDEVFSVFSLLGALLCVLGVLLVAWPPKSLDRLPSRA